MGFPSPTHTHEAAAAGVSSAQLKQSGALLTLGDLGDQTNHDFCLTVYTIHTFAYIYIYVIPIHIHIHILYTYKTVYIYVYTYTCQQGGKWTIKPLEAVVSAITACVQ